MYRLDNPVRDYAWGSTTHIPKFCGLPLTDGPVAEMWFGAHPAAPSRVNKASLDQVISDAPIRTLGSPLVAAFGPRLPFLMKLLAASEPLSLQVHPTSERARIRYAQQESAGLARDAVERSYPDASHKPELIYALTRFEGMAGFRDLDKSARILRLLKLPWLDAVADELNGSTTAYQTLRGVVTSMLNSSGRELTNRLDQLHDAAERAEKRAHRPQPRFRPPAIDPSSVEREGVRVFAQTVQLVERYPNDAGVLVTLLLNHVVLAAGDAMFIDAGVIHAYTSGFGIEIMAASDNVLRAGLTLKHIDIPELLDVTRFTPMPPPHWAGQPVDEPTGVLLAPPVDEFELLIATFTRGEHFALANRPLIVLCLSGDARVSTETNSEHLLPGQSIFVEASEHDAVISGEGRVALARSPLRN